VGLIIESKLALQRPRAVATVAGNMKGVVGGLSSLSFGGGRQTRCEMDSNRQRELLAIILLRTLAGSKEGLETRDVYDHMGAEYDFPEEWYREIPDSAGFDYLTKHGYKDWRKIPQSRLIELVKTEPQWQNELRWARNQLRREGYLDTSAPRGTWRLTSTGMNAGKEIRLDKLTPAEREIVTKQRARSKERRQDQPPTAPASGQREALLKKLETLIRSMPLADLELLIDLARVVRRRSLTEDEDSD
jgi:hypothetical protein